MKGFKRTALILALLSPGVSAATISPVMTDFDLPDDATIAFFPGWGFRGVEECTEKPPMQTRKYEPVRYDCTDKPMLNGKGFIATEKWEPLITWEPQTYAGTSYEVTPEPRYIPPPWTPPWTPPSTVPWIPTGCCCCGIPPETPPEETPEVPLGPAGWFLAFSLALLTTFGVYKNAARQPHR